MGRGFFKSFELKEGGNLILRSAEISDAQNLIDILRTADSESKFLAREPGEFRFTLEQEESLIGIWEQTDAHEALVAYLDGQPVGMCSVSFVRNNLRYLHRGECALIVLRDYWDRGIGGRMMLSIIDWCKMHGIEQLELDVVENNSRGKKMYESFGFKELGRLQNGLKYADGQYANLIYMVKTFQ